jgi:hypothetical protein
MSRHPANNRTPANLLEQIIVELATFPARIPRALEVMSDARSPLRANSYEANINGGTGPDPGQTEIAAKAEHNRRALLRTIRDLDMQSRILRSILDEWNPQQTKTGLTIWCQNHLTHGQREPCADDRSTNCRWCMDVHRTWKTWPTRALIELHDRGRRITEPEYRRLLGKTPAA